MPESEFAHERFAIKATGDAARNYDFVTSRKQGKTTNVAESIGHLVKGCLGGGVVAIHESYKNNGLISSLVLNAVLGAFVTYCVYMLVSSAQILYGRIQEPLLSYPDVAEAAIAIGPFKGLRKFHKCFRYSVDVTIAIDLFGSCCVYIVVMARTIKQLVEGSQIVVDEGNPNIRMYILALMLPCILLCMIRTLKYLAPFSIVADVFIVTVVLSTIYYGSHAAKKSPLEFSNYKGLPGLFEFIGVCVFSMEGVGVSMAIENSMTNPRKFPIVLVGGMSIVTSMVMIVGFFGYWGYGDEAMSPVTVNFPWSPFPILLKVFLGLMIYVTFALNFWVPFDLVWYYLKRRHNESKYWIWERVYRAIHVIAITIIAFVFPNVSSFIALLGSFCLSCMGFMIPAVIDLSLNYEDPGLGILKWRMFKFIAIFTFGVVLCVYGTYINAVALWVATQG